MQKPRAEHDDVPFDWAAADRLVTLLRRSAQTLAAQVPARNAMAEDARAEWRGAFAAEFERRMAMSARDARMIADAMLLAAGQVGELSERARREQRRREVVREWERDQANRSIVEKFTDWSGLTDDELPPVAPAEPPHRYTATVDPVGRRH